MRRALAAVALAVAVASCSTADRPEGVLERWLQAVGDLGREGLRADAEERVAEGGDAALVAQLVPAEPEEDERHFEGIEVGRGRERSADQADVPFRLSRRLAGGDSDEVSMTAVLARAGDSWRIVAVRPREAGEEVPSEGGAQPAGATGLQWALAVFAAVAFGVVSVVLIERGSPRQPAPTA
jgi:hypothetical protein